MSEREIYDESGFVVGKVTDSKTIRREEHMLLENMIDRYTVAALLDVLQEICFQKSEHIAHYWQDAPTAKRWATIAHRIDQVRGAAFNLEL